MTKQALFIFDMGDEVKDVVSGFQGFVVGRFEFLTGCNHYGVEAKAKEQKVPYESIDEQRLQLVKAGAVKLVRTYGDPERPRRTSPGRTPSRNTERHA